MAGGRKKSGQQAKQPIAPKRGFGPALRRCRHRGGYTQEVLADRAGLHRTEISLLERGLRKPGYEVLIRLIGALAVDSNELLEDTWIPFEDGKKGRFTYPDPQA